MIPAIAWIVGVYAIARLIQVPLEFSPQPGTGWWNKRFVAMSTISAAGVIVIVNCLLGVLNASQALSEVPAPNEVKARSEFRIKKVGDSTYYVIDVEVPAKN